MLYRKPLSGVRGAALALSLIAGIVGWGASVAQATPQNGLNPNETLAQLIALNGPGGGVQIGNLIFNNFSYVGSPAPNPAPDTTHISVSNYQFSTPSKMGLEFSSGWEGFAGGSVQESKISFSVQAATGFVLSQVQLDFNGAIVSPGFGTPVPAGTSASVTETVYPADSNGTPIGTPQQLSVFNNSNNPGSVSGNQSSITLTSPLTSIFVQKDIQLSGTNAGTVMGISTISFVDNGYTVGVGSPIPEPASAALLGIFGMGLLARRRRG